MEILFRCIEAGRRYYGVRLNPSDTGNFRMQSLWHLGDALRLSFDASWQYTLANGGGTSTIGETPAATSPDKRVLGNTNLVGFDLNVVAPGPDVAKTTPTRPVALA